MKSEAKMQSAHVKPAKIIIGERFRKDLGDLSSLQESIQSKGLLHPIVIDRCHNLIAGLRRLRACEALGWETVPATILDLNGMSDIGSVEMELDENECRKDFTTTERVAIAEAIREAIGSRQGTRTDLETQEGEPVAVNLPEVPQGQEVREAAAKAAGFGSEKTFRDAKKVTEQGTPELQKLMDEELIAPSTAATAAELPPKQQDKIAEEVRSGKSSASAAVKKRTGRKKAESTPEKDKPAATLDKAGHAIPATVAEPFADLAAFEEIDALVRSLQKSIDQLSRRPGGLQLRGCLQATGSTDENVIHKSEHLNALKRDLKFTRPYSVCPYCCGKATAGCKGCSGAGWVTKTTWDSIEDRIKEKLPCV